MTASDFPTRLADLTLNDSSHNPSLYASLRSLRKSTLSIHNRLNSILEDARFAKEVSRHYGFPLVANERCGSWYIEPGDKAGSAYFKSTDGHHGQWDFSSRRLNLQLLPILAAHGGAIIVDSTRRGKNLPDALSKTVPIWVSVVNRALFPMVTSMHRVQAPPPPDDLGSSEISQIEERLDGFTTTFCGLGLDLQRLRNQLGRPIRISWATNGYCNTESGGRNHTSDETGSFPDHNGACHQLVLCSASRRVRGAEVSEGGYIQGAGDDSEGWAQGLTAQLFWEHQELLMRTSEEELPALLDELLEREQHRLPDTQVTRILPTSNIYIAVGPLEKVDGFDLVINCQGDVQGSNSDIVFLHCRPSKLGSKDLRDKLPLAVDAAMNQLSKHSKSKILITCSTGQDLSAGVAVAILCLLYSEEGESCTFLLVSHQTNNELLGQLRKSTEIPVLNKQLVKRRLAWVTCSKADANPSRATLQAVNSFLM